MQYVLCILCRPIVVCILAVCACGSGWLRDILATGNFVHPRKLINTKHHEHFGSPDLILSTTAGLLAGKQLQSHDTSPTYTSQLRGMSSRFGLVVSDTHVLSQFIVIEIVFIMKRNKLYNQPNN